MKILLCINTKIIFSPTILIHYNFIILLNNFYSLTSLTVAVEVLVLHGLLSQLILVNYLKKLLNKFLRIYNIKII